MLVMMRYAVLTFICTVSAAIAQVDEKKPDLLRLICEVVHPDGAIYNWFLVIEQTQNGVDWNREANRKYIERYAESAHDKEEIDFIENGEVLGYEVMSDYRNTVLPFIEVSLQIYEGEVGSDRDDQRLLSLRRSSPTFKGKGIFGRHRRELRTEILDADIGKIVIKGIIRNDGSTIQTLEYEKTGDIYGLTCWYPYSFIPY